MGDCRCADEVLDEHHARPFVGVFQKSISIRFINFWRYFPTKTNQWLQERTWDTPTKGLLWLASLASETVALMARGVLVQGHLAHKKPHPPEDHHRALCIALL